MSVSFKYILILLIGLAIRCALIFSGPYLSPDGVHYLRLGYHLWHDFSYTSGGAMFPDIIQPPFYPFVAGFFSLFMPLLWAGKIASLLAGMLTIHVIYRFLEKFGRKQALIGAKFTAGHPGLAAISAQAASEAWYILFITLWVLDGWRFVRGERNATRLGVWGALGALTRPEMLVYILFFMAFVGFLRFRKKIAVTAASLAGLAAPLVILILLYGAWAQSELGYFTISPKINFVRIQSKLARVALNTNPSLKKQPEKIRSYRSFYGTDPEGRQLMSHALLYKEPEAINWLHQHAWSRGGFRPAAFIKAVTTNLIKMLKKTITGTGLPVLYALFGVYGLILLLGENKRAAGYLFMMILPLSMYLFVHVENRFLLGSWPALVWPVAMAGSGVLRKWPRRLGWTVVLLVILIGGLPAWSNLPASFSKTDKMYKEGRAIRPFLTGKGIVMSRKPQVAFFAGHPYRLLPFAPIEKLSVYSRYQGVDYLFLEKDDLALNPALSQIIANPSPVNGALLVKGDSYWLFHLKSKEGHHGTEN